ncbi:eukaryotic translation initiation factor 4B2-like [Rutidosis leptorrhynchoides]|uniref:eukaryotic translation initiation factor 4B2-like n=1 Tax=Rutidosis leptorrhynchoides TaxID=125765 RepID=UPI003A9974A0
MSKTWGNIGAWAAEAERAEAEEKEQEAAAAAAAAAAPPQSYPSLREAVNTNKGKKKTKMTLQEFTMASTGTGGYKGLTPEEMMRLPTGPKERSAEEMQYGRLGGGFSSYGGGRSGGGPRNRDGDGDGAWGSNRRSYGGFDDENRRGSNSRVSDFDQQPSRADEVDNWANTKKTPSFDSSSTRGNRYSGLSSTGPGAFGSRADEIDNWTVNKKPITPVVTPTRSSSFGFRDSGGPEQDRWSRGVALPREPSVTERRRLVLDPPKGEGSVNEPVVKSNKPNPFGNARPREEILAEKGLDWKKVDLELDHKKVSSRPTSSHSNSRPGSAQSGRSVEGQGSGVAALQGLEKPKVKVNPFGDAKPREVLLQEKGVDYRKIDLELERRRLGRPETDEEKHLKEEIYNLKKEFEKQSNENQTNIHDAIIEKETELEKLSRDLDDKLRFVQKSTERPGSGAGRVGPGYQERPGSGAGRVGPGYQERPGSGAGRLGSGYQERPGSGAGRMGPAYPERPPSQSGSFDGSRNFDFSDRPRSRGDPWMRTGPPGDDKRGFGGGMDRGYMGNREPGRSNSKERW